MASDGFLNQLWQRFTLYEVQFNPLLLTECKQRFKKKILVSALIGGMLKVGHLVRSMANQRLVHPIEKGILTDHKLNVDIKKLVPPAAISPDSISQRPAPSWWTNVLDIEARNIKVYECTKSINSLVCSELCLLRCPDRCCMNWTLYDNADCLSSTQTKCLNLHQICLYTQTLSDLARLIGEMTEWPIHFIIFESVNTSLKVPMHLNCLGSMVDSVNILLLNPNPFPLTVVLQEKDSGATSVAVPKKRGRKMRHKVSGRCQLTFNIGSGKVMCIANKTTSNWNIYTVSATNPNYILCVMGRYDMDNKKLLRGKELTRFCPVSNAD